MRSRPRFARLACALAAASAFQIAAIARAQETDRPVWVSEFAVPPPPGQKSASPVALTLDGHGHVLVGDRSGSIARFDLAGHAVDVWRADTLDIAPTRRLRNLAPGPDGGLLLVEEEPLRVRLLDAKGAPRWSVRSQGNDFGQLDRPGDVDTDAFGCVYIADVGSRKVLVYSPDGIFLGEIRGPKDHDFETPFSLAAGGDGSLRLVAENAKKLVRLGADGRVLEERALTGPDLVEEPGAVSWSRLGILAVLDQSRCQVDFFAAGSGGIRKSFGGRGTSRGLFARPLDCVLAGDSLWVLDARDPAPVVQCFRVSPAWVLGADARAAAAPGANAVPRSPMVRREGVVAHGFNALIKRRGELLALPLEGNWVEKWDPASDKTWSVGKVASLKEPVALVPREAGGWYLVDRDTRQVVACDSLGNESFRFGGKGSQAGDLDEPAGIVETRWGDLLVCDRGRHRLMAYGRDGIPAAACPVRAGVKDGFEPVAVARDGEGNPYVLDAKTNRVFEFAQDGRTLREFVPVRAQGAGDVKLAAFAVDWLGYVYLLDEESGSVQVFGPGGGLALTFGARGDAKIRGQWQRPNAVAVDESLLVYVSDRDGKKTEIFRMVHQPPEITGTRILCRATGVGLDWTLRTLGDARRFEVYESAGESAPERLGWVVEKPGLDLVPATNELTGPLYYRVVSVSTAGVRSRNTDRLPDLISWGRELARRGETAAAAAAMDSALTRAPGDSVLARELTGLCRGEARAAAGAEKLELAETFLRTVIHAVPGDAASYLELATLERRRNRLDEASRVLAEGLAKAPDDRSLREEQVRTLFADHKLAEARASVEPLVAGAGATSAVYRLLSQILAEQDSLPQAVTAAQKATHLDSTNVDLKLELGDLFTRSNRLDEAWAVYRGCNDEANPRSDVLERIGRAELALGNRDEAVPHLEKAVALDPKRLPLLLFLANTYLAADETAKALPLLDRAGDLDPKNFDVHKQLGDLARDHNDSPLAAKAYRVCAELHPTDAAGWFDLGIALRKTGDLRGAVEALQQARTVEPDNQSYRDEGKKTRAELMKSLAAKPFVEITRLDLGPIFPAFIEHYRSSPSGRIVITNNRDSTWSGARLRVEVPAAGTTFETDLADLKPLERRDMPLYVNWDAQVLTAIQVRATPATATVSCMRGAAQDSVTSKLTVTLQARDDFTWGDRRGVGAFVNPEDVLVDAFARQSLVGVDRQSEGYPFRHVVTAMRIYDALGALGIGYVPDPASTMEAALRDSSALDHILFAGESLIRKGGDCDDLVTLYASCLANVGIHTAYFDTGDHVFPAFDPEWGSADLASIGVDSSMVVTREGRRWIPVEATLVGGTFADAWKEGVEHCRLAEIAGTPARLFIFDDAWKTYPPANLPGEEATQLAAVDTSAANRLFVRDLNYVGTRRLEIMLARDQRLVTADPGNLFYINETGILLARSGHLNDAVACLERGLALDPVNAAILNNLGNVYFMGKQYPQAVDYLTRAAAADTNDAEILVNLARSLDKAGRTPEARAELEKAYQAQPALVTRYGPREQLISAEAK